MLTAINPTVRRGRLMLALALTACSSDTIMVERETGGGNTFITVINDGAVALTTLRIRTSERDTLPVIASLAAGGTAGVYAVGTLHSAPLVRATVNGKEIVANPVEGFSGFNPALTEGTYAIRIRLTPDSNMLDIRVAPVARALLVNRSRQ